MLISPHTIGLAARPAVCPLIPRRAIDWFLCYFVGPVTGRTRVKMINKRKWLFKVSTTNAILRRYLYVLFIRVRAKMNKGKCAIIMRLISLITAFYRSTYTAYTLYRAILVSSEMIYTKQHISINFCVLKNGSAFDVQCDVYQWTTFHLLNRSL